MKTDGIGRQMLFGNPKPSDETDPFFEFQKMRNIYLWKGPGLFKINTIDLETPILHIFPFVSIEEFNNQDFHFRYGSLFRIPEASVDQSPNRLLWLLHV